MIGTNFSGCSPFELISMIHAFGYSTSTSVATSRRNVGSPPERFRLSNPPGSLARVSAVTSSLGSVGFFQM